LKQRFNQPLDILILWDGRLDMVAAFVLKSGDARRVAVLTIAELRNCGTDSKQRYDVIVGIPSWASSSTLNSFFQRISQTRWQQGRLTQGGFSESVEYKFPLSGKVGSLRLKFFRVYYGFSPSNQKGKVGQGMRDRKLTSKKSD
jgi:hypothetical protein